VIRLHHRRCSDRQGWRCRHRDHDGDGEERIADSEAGANFEVIALHTAAIAATFTDPGTKDTHTALINWGDGNAQAVWSARTAGSGNVTGSHVYPFPGSYVVTVVVMDKDSGTGSDTLTVTVLGPTDLKSRAAASLMPYKAESKEIESAIGTSG